MLGKFLAAWISALAFLVAATPFLAIACAFGGVGPGTIAVSLLVLAAELGVIAAVGVGLSGLIRRPLFSVVLSYLFVALLSVGTVIGFGLGGAVIQTPVTVNVSAQRAAPDIACEIQRYSTSVPRFDLVWWMLAANPYVVIADAEPSHLNATGNPQDIFDVVALGVRSAQLTPPELAHPTRCDQLFADRSPREVMQRTTPSWAVGLLIQLGLGFAALAGAVATTRAPSRRLAAGSRIA